MYRKSKSLENSGFYTKNEEKKNVLFRFEGIMDYRTVDYLLNNAVKELNILSIAKSIQKKAFRIMMESLENVLKHSGNSPGCHTYSKFELTRSKSELIFNTSNFVLNTNKFELQEKIEEINQSGIEKLKKMQEKKLITGEITEKGGFGIGLINIAIRSNNKLEYKFETIDNETSHFNLQIKIKI